MYGSFLFFFYRTLLTPSFSQCVWCCEKNCIMNVSLYREEWSLQEEVYSLKRRKNETSSEDYIAAGRISIRCKQHSKFHLPLSSLAPFDLFLCVFCLRLHESVTKPFAPQKSDHPTNLFKYLSTPYLMIFTHSSWPSNLFEFITKFVYGWFLYSLRKHKQRGNFLFRKNFNARWERKPMGLSKKTFITWSIFVYLANEVRAIAFFLFRTSDSWHDLTVIWASFLLTSVQQSLFFSIFLSSVLPWSHYTPEDGKGEKEQILHGPFNWWSCGVIVNLTWFEPWLSLFPFHTFFSLISIHPRVWSLNGIIQQF